MNSLEELEREIIQPLQRQIATQNRSTSSRGFSWTLFFSALGAFFLGTTITGLGLIQNQMKASWNETAGKFQWLVFAEGDQIAIDEVGRFLGKIDGASEVSFVSPEETLTNVKNDPVLSSDLALLETNPFPACWRVHWKPTAFANSKMNEALQDVQVFPGVVSVASDPRIIERLKELKSQIQHIQILFSVLLGVISVFFTFVLGRILFSNWRRRINPKHALWLVSLCILSACLGGGLLLFLW